MFRAAGAAFLLSMLALWTATEVAAVRFAFQPALGKPLAPKVYEPWAGLLWEIRFAHAPDPRVHAILGQFWLVLLVGLAIAFVCALALAIKPMMNRNEHSDLHGSAHWATENEIKATGLLDGGAGVYVGAWLDSGGRKRYLRHDGPEHVLAFAPTRSGKGVGLVLPTLYGEPPAPAYNAFTRSMQPTSSPATSGLSGNGSSSRLPEKYDEVARYGKSSNPDVSEQEQANMFGMMQSTPMSQWSSEAMRAMNDDPGLRDMAKMAASEQNQALKLSQDSQTALGLQGFAMAVPRDSAPPTAAQIRLGNPDRL